MINNTTATTLDMVQDSLEGIRTSYAGETTTTYGKGYTCVPFAVVGYDNGHAWDDWYPDYHFLSSAHRTRESAERFFARVADAGFYSIKENFFVDNWEIEEKGWSD